MAWSWASQEATVTVFSDIWSMKAQVQIAVSQTVAQLKQKVYDNSLSKYSGFCCLSHPHSPYMYFNLHHLQSS